MINQTHAVELTSWVGDSEQFPIQNLPMAICKPEGASSYGAVIAIADKVLCLRSLYALNLLQGDAAKGLAHCQSERLNDFMALPSPIRSAFRSAISSLLAEGAAEQEKVASCLFPLEGAEYAMPCHIGDYTDFYTSIYHATSVGKLFRPDNPLLPNYKWIPIGYHGRASSVDVSPQNFHRPTGQTKAPDQDQPSLGPCRRLDYELELGIFIGPGNNLGEQIAIERAEDHVFGICLFNDWSARDLQAWEYQPLGPFLAKSFASTISPWIVTMEALAPYRVPFERNPEDPQPLPYLTSDQNTKAGAIDISLECYLLTESMAERGLPAHRLSSSSFRHSYWTISQMVAHHSVNGCNLQSGDLLGSGTQSGPKPEEAGSLLELSGAGKNPITLPSGETRTFLEDGDTVILRGYCEAPGAKRIGLGEAVGKVLPSVTA